jgi:type IV pilus assembly protein PilA
MSNTLTSRLKKKKKGFTLIELIIVMAIIVILAAIAIPGFSKIRDDSRKKSDNASADTIKKTVMTLLTDGQLKAGDSFTIVPHDGSDATISAYSPATGEISATDLAGYFKDVHLPQQSGQKTYTVQVQGNEDVTVTTATN